MRDDKGPAPDDLRQNTVLIIEGDPGVARLLKGLFVNEGWGVDVFGNGLRGGEAIRSNKPYDLVVISYVVPGAHKLELVKLLRALPHRRQTPILMVTGSGAVENEAFEAGVNEVLHKPFDMQELVSAARKYAARRKGKADNQS